MAKQRHDAATVEEILAGEHPASGWLQSGEGLDELSLIDALSAIEAARRSEAGERLAAARRTASSKRIRKAAGAALHRLKSSGVKVAATTSRQWVPRAGLDDVPPPRALLGLPDPSGGFPFVCIAFSREDGCACAGLASAGQGHSDADHAHVTRSTARGILDGARRDQHLLDVPFHVALHFVQSAFAQGGRGHPHGWDHMIASVPEGVLTSARLLDPLAGQPAVLSEDALHDIEPLLDPRGGVFLSLSEPLMHQSFTKVMAALTSAIELDDEARRQRIQSIIDETADDLLDATSRRTWTLAMDVTTYLAGLQDNEPLQTAARHTALALRADRAGRDIPFITHWVNIQLQSAVEMFTQMNQGKAEADAPSPIVLTDS